MTPCPYGMISQSGCYRLPSAFASSFFGEAVTPQGAIASFFISAIFLELNMQKAAWLRSQESVECGKVIKRMRSNPNDLDEVNTELVKQIRDVLYSRSELSNFIPAVLLRVSRSAAILTLKICISGAHTASQSDIIHAYLVYTVTKTTKRAQPRSQFDSSLHFLFSSHPSIRISPKGSDEKMSSFLLFCIAQIPTAVSKLYLDHNG
jgi:hypothetical protein